MPQDAEVIAIDLELVKGEDHTQGETGPSGPRGNTMFGAPGWTQSRANSIKPMRRKIYGTAHHEMESSMAGTADHARPAT